MTHPTTTMFHHKNTTLKQKMNKVARHGRMNKRRSLVDNKQKQPTSEGEVTGMCMGFRLLN